MTRKSLLLTLLSGAALCCLPQPSFGQSPEPEAKTSCKAEDCCDVGKTALETFQKTIKAQRGLALSSHPAAIDRDDLARAIPNQLNIGYRDLPSLQPLLKKHSLSVVETMPSFNIVTVQSTKKQDLRVLVKSLKASKILRFVEANYLIKSATLPNDPFLPRQKGLTNSSMEAAWQLSKGDGVIVAVLDTGVDINHPDLQGRLLPGYDFVNNSPMMRDDNGHGTAIAGIIAARADNGHGIAGVAPKALILPIKVADRSGIASIATVLKGIQMAVGRGAKIINLSMGTRLPSVALRGAVSAAYLSGVTVISSAGNDAGHKAMYPAAWPEVLGVTVTSDEGQLGFSGVLASSVSLAAPGEEIPTTLPGGVYGFISGSSASAAMASGIAALALSKEPKLTPLTLGLALVHSQDPIDSLEPFRETYTFGRMNALRAVQRAKFQLSDVKIDAISVSPAHPLPGQRCVARVTLVNAGYSSTQNFKVVLDANDFLGKNYKLKTISQDAMDIGERKVLDIVFNAPPKVGAFSLTAEIAGSNTVEGQKTLALPGEFLSTNDRRSLGFPVIQSPRSNLRIISRTMTDPDLSKGTARFEVIVENIGNTLVASAEISATIAGKALTAPSRSNPLSPGQRHRFVLNWTIPKPAPTGMNRFQAHLTAENGEQDLSDNQTAFDFVVGRSDQLESLYQQSNSVDVIHDAPRLILASHPYVPVQVFVPSKGSIGNITKLETRELLIKVADNNKGTGARVLYKDTRGASPSVSPTGLVIVDELGQDIGSTELFSGQDVTDNGHHNVLRLPRAEFQLTSAVKQARYVDVKLSWAYKRTILWVFSITRTGSHRKVLKVEFLPSALPQLPGDNHYYDVHHHTIAEWFFDNPLNIVAPRKAYGGPLQMVKEMAHGMGVTPGIDQVFGLIITTDHNAFFNETVADPSGPKQRPPFGPASITAQPGTTEFDAYRNIFGPSAGEELAVKQNVPIPSVNNFVDQLTAILPGIPLGAHMLTYLGNHVEGPWHGGGFLGGPNINVNLKPTLNDLAKNDQAKQSKAFTYAAHPFGGMGWNEDNFNQTFGLIPSARNRDHIHDGSQKFVLKGLEFWNGAGRRKLKSSKIDFKNLDPWSDDDFAQGNKGWDGGVHSGLIRWHSFLSKTLDYSFVSDPETVFIRKIYVAAGSDAHGDFNFSTGRTATPLSLKATYSVSDSHLFDARTYVFGDGKPGANNYDRYMAAYGDGNTIMTDGPVLQFSMDANTKFNSTDLIWHDSVKLSEDKEG
ncbi:MAG: S8 family serine peptidase, partial [Planctomycetota bacterium]|nr:S8 family serine peptidase [Planctomycetota bacterium]